MRIIYRISDKGYNKVKPKYINNEKVSFSNNTKMVLGDYYDKA